MLFSRIVGTGGYVPQDILSNEDLERLVDTNDEWIMKRVGVRERHIIGESSDTTTTMSASAARRAAEMAGIDVQEIDMIIVGTATPEHFFPSTACMIQKELGIEPDIPAFDVNAACAGFVYCLSIADQFIRSGSVKRVLAIGADALSKWVDWTDRSTCILFGDGAGAFILEASDKPGILSTHLHANGKYADLIYASNNIWNPVADQKIHMKGNEVFKIAVTKLGEAVDESLQKCGLKQSDINWLIPHQANFRIIAALAKRLGLPLERVVLTIENHGNTSAASIPLAMDQAIRQGKIKRGETLLLEAFGAGLAWGSAIIKY